MKKHVLHDNVYTIDNFLTADECDSLIQLATECKDTFVYDKSWIYNEDWKLPNPAYKSIIYKGQYKLITNIEKRLASTIGIPIE